MSLKAQRGHVDPSPSSSTPGAVAASGATGAGRARAACPSMPSMSFALRAAPLCRAARRVADSPTLSFSNTVELTTMPAKRSVRPAPSLPDARGPAPLVISDGPGSLGGRGAGRAAGAFETPWFSVAGGVQTRKRRISRGLLRPDRLPQQPNFRCELKNFRAICVNYAGFWAT